VVKIIQGRIGPEYLLKDIKTGIEHGPVFHTWLCKDEWEIHIHIG